MQIEFVPKSQTGVMVGNWDYGAELQKLYSSPETEGLCEEGRLSCHLFTSDNKGIHNIKDL